MRYLWMLVLAQIAIGCGANTTVEKGSVVVTSMASSPGKMTPPLKPLGK